MSVLDLDNIPSYLEKSPLIKTYSESNKENDYNEDNDIFIIPSNIIIFENDIVTDDDKLFSLLQTCNYFLVDIPFSVFEYIKEKKLDLKDFMDHVDKNYNDYNIDLENFCPLKFYDFKVKLHAEYKKSLLKQIDEKLKDLINNSFFDQIMLLINVNWNDYNYNNNINTFKYICEESSKKGYLNLLIFIIKLVEKFKYKLIENAPTNKNCLLSYGKLCSYKVEDLKKKIDDIFRSIPLHAIVNCNYEILEFSIQNNFQCIDYNKYHLDIDNNIKNYIKNHYIDNKYEDKVSIINYVKCLNLLFCNKFELEVNYYLKYDDYTETDDHSEYYNEPNTVNHNIIYLYYLLKIFKAKKSQEFIIEFENEIFNIIKNNALIEYVIHIHIDFNDIDFLKYLKKKINNIIFSKSHLINAIKKNLLEIVKFMMETDFSYTQKNCILREIDSIYDERYDDYPPHYFNNETYKYLKSI